MSALLIEPPEQISIFDQMSERTEWARGIALDSVPTGDGPTLDELIVGAWEGLSARHTVTCPACGGAMRPRRTAGPAGDCDDCGASLG